MSMMRNERRDRSVRLAFEQEAEALFDQALCICFAAGEVLDIARPGGDAVEPRLRGGYFDFVNVRLLFHDATLKGLKHQISHK